MDLKEINPSTLLGARKVYFIGIGGIGMSAVARMFTLRSLGGGGLVQISGSDRSKSLVTEELEKLGIKVFYEQKAENIANDIDLVIYTIAITEDNPELRKARELGIRCLTYPEMLGVISDGKYTVAVAGTHGKTTTTAMIAEMMIEAGLDPTVVVGSLLGSGTNFIAGQSQYLVVEACEYRRSFLNLHPTLAVITNIDNDHLDYYKDLADIQSAFAEFAGRLPSDGYLVCDVNDPLLASAIESAKKKGVQIIDYSQLGGLTSKLDLQVPGKHNLENAKGALAVGEVLGISPSTMLGALNKFNGTWRRFEFKGKTKGGAWVYDDYAHHPTEVSATIQAGREFMKKKGLGGKLIIAFQPHLYSRTKLLKEDFARVLAQADEIILAPIYAAREAIDPEINSEILGNLIKGKNDKIKVVNNLEEVKNYLIENNKNGDLIITMGAGDISTIGAQLVEAKA
ncbi:MAG: UDP-N-acetylmuramate--L-alanine ligase [Candidatus Paceibacterota bacterium]|jgi:UDP-N-acetylmuramate--alanine ligase